ncbi:hypothetical protein ACFQZ8_10030 [Micromonospora azadirachtae]|uniref:PIN domain-containing protein n=1 Tax=Micromonospora azadirachtae TaxID=1970735 RepID=A0ABW3A033_9ACTN
MSPDDDRPVRLLLDRSALLAYVAGSVLSTRGHSWQELSYWRTYTGRVDLATTIMASFDHDASILTRENIYGEGELPVIYMPE